MWSEGEVVVRREVLNDGRVWAEIPVIVVRDTPDLLATYIAEGAPLRFPAGRWPTADGLHPWHGKSTWSGHGTLMLQRPDDMHAIWHFWKGDEREFAGWYINPRAVSTRRRRLRHAGPRARPLAAEARAVGMEGRRPPRAARPRGAVHAQAGGKCARRGRAYRD